MRRKADLIRVLTTIGVFLLLEVVSIVMIAKHGVVHKYQVLGSVRKVQMFFWERADGVRKYFNYGEENKILIEENGALKRALAEYRYASPQEDSSNVVSNSLYLSIPATIIKNSTNKQHNYLVIDKGSKDGVSRGMGVVSEKGVIGIVNNVSEHFAYVVSFLNTNQSISAKISKNDIFGPLEWSGSSIKKAILREIPLHANVAEGDTISTSGYSAIFPADIPVGVVTGQSVIDGVYLNIDIDLFQDFNAIRHVEVVSIRNKEEIDLLSND